MENQIQGSKRDPDSRSHAKPATYNVKSSQKRSEEMGTPEIHRQDNKNPETKHSTKQILREEEQSEVQINCFIVN